MRYICALWIKMQEGPRDTQNTYAHTHASKLATHDLAAKMLSVCVCMCVNGLSCVFFSGGLLNALRGSHTILEDINKANVQISTWYERRYFPYYLYHTPTDYWLTERNGCNANTIGKQLWKTNSHARTLAHVNYLVLRQPRNKMPQHKIQQQQININSNTHTYAHTSHSWMECYTHNSQAMTTTMMMIDDFDDDCVCYVFQQQGCLDVRNCVRVLQKLQTRKAIT